MYEFKIDLLATNHVFEKGHQMRLDISSSNFPRFDRNTNSGLERWEDSQETIVIANQKIFHEGTTLVLPFVSTTHDDVVNDAKSEM